MKRAFRQALVSRCSTDHMSAVLPQLVGVGRAFQAVLLHVEPSASFRTAFGNQVTFLHKFEFRAADDESYIRMFVEAHFEKVNPFGATSFASRLWPLPSLR